MLLLMLLMIISNFSAYEIHSHDTSSGVTSDCNNKKSKVAKKARQTVNLA